MEESGVVRQGIVRLTIPVVRPWAPWPSRRNHMALRLRNPDVISPLENDPASELRLGRYPVPCSSSQPSN